MGCLIAGASLLVPRFVLFVLWAFTNYLDRAFESGWWALLGFFFLPTTTVAWAIAENELDGGVRSVGGVILVIVGVLLDLGALGGGAKSRKQRAAEA